MRRRKTPVEIERTEPHLCSMDLRLHILHGVPFFSALRHEQIEEINQQFHEKGFSLGDFLYYSGDPAESLYIIAEGRVKLLRHTTSGKDVLLDLLIPGEFFGGLSTASGSTYFETAQALTSVCALTISRDNFRAILTRYPDVGMQVLDLVTARLEAAHATIQQLSSQSADQRIAYTLLNLAGKLGETHEVGLLIQTPLSRDELADMTATTPETVSRVISQFQRDGYINTGREWIAVTDLSALREIAEITF
ncbi:MAG TPA: Crp/Fnr family transcriptional regulator [Bellilinea sp.]|nr:Crp/Fnr family transcriptional regulator [Bellilinea sp.]